MSLLEDVRKAQADQIAAKAELEVLKGEVKVLKEQVLGERGLSQTINQQTVEIRGLRKAAYWVAGVIVAGSIGFGFSVLQLIG